MKVLLINPPVRNEGEVWVREGRCQQFDIWGVPFPPLSLAYVRTQLQDIADTRLMDPASHRKPLADVLREIHEFAPVLTILSTTTPTFYSDCVWFAAELKRQVPTMKIAALGIHVSVLPHESLRQAPDLDFIINGEPEPVAPALVRAVAGEIGFDQVRGLTMRCANGTIVNTPPVEAPERIDDYGLPDWDGLCFDYYRLPIKNRPFTMIAFSRGCPHSCTYCAAAAYYGKKIRRRSIESIMHEIDENETAGISDFLFWTEMIGPDKDYLDKFVDALLAREKPINWVCNSRPDHLDPDILRKMHRAGCWQIALGLEFGTNKALALTRKGGTATVEQNKDTVAMIDHAGIAADGHFILGYPGESRADLDATISYAASLPLTFAHFYTATPFPGSPLYQAMRERYKLDQRWKHISQDQYLFNQEGLDSSVLERQVRRAYRTFYLHPGRMLKILKLAQTPTEKWHLFKTGTGFIRDLVLAG